MAQRGVAQWWFILLLLVVAGIVAGCSQPKNPPAKTSEGPRTTVETPPPQPPPLPPTATAEINLILVTSSELEEAIKSNKGKIVVVDFWATHCVPCKREFPHLVELHKKYGPDSVACLSVSTDLETDQAKALSFLRGQHAMFANYLLNEDATAAEEKWNLSGGIPVVNVYDRDGKLAKQFNNKEPNHFTYAEVEQLVQELLAKK